MARAFLEVFKEFDGVFLSDADEAGDEIISGVAQTGVLEGIVSTAAQRLEDAGLLLVGGGALTPMVVRLFGQLRRLGAMKLTWIWPHTAITIATTILFAILAQVIINMAIRHTVEIARNRVEAHRPESRTGKVLKASGLASERAAQRTATLGSLLRSIAGFIIWLVAILTIMAALGLPLAPLLASAGVGGLALGFGAQSLVKDFLSGIFMIVEDQYGVGDFVDLGTVSGTVEEVSLRVTRIRDTTGQVWYVRNGEITKVGNLSQGWSTGMVDIPVAYDTDPAKAVTVLTTMVQGLDLEQDWAAPLLEPPAVLGVDSVSATTMTLRLMIKTLPNQHWSVQRELRQRAMDALAAAEIKGPSIPMV